MAAEIDTGGHDFAHRDSHGYLSATIMHPLIDQKEFLSKMMDFRRCAIDGENFREAAFPGVKTISRIGDIISFPGIHDPEGKAARHQDGGKYEEQREFKTGGHRTPQRHEKKRHDGSPRPGH